MFFINYSLTMKITEEQANNLYEVLAELEESSSYWSEYDVPLGIVERISDALNAIRHSQA